MMIIQSNTNVNTENKTKKLCIFDKERNEMWRASYINRGRWKTVMHRRKGEKICFSSLRTDKTYI